MEAKKTRKANLQNRRVLFLEAGLAIALLAVVYAFNWGQTEKTVIQMGISLPTPPLPPVTTPEQKRPEIKVQQNEVFSEFIREMNNNTKITSEPTFEDFDPDGTVQVFGVIEKEVDDIPPVYDAEEMAKFMGGDLNTFRNWVQSNISYPRAAAETNIQGKVTLKFIIEKDGTLTHIEEIASPHSSLTEETVRILKQSPKWTPAKQRNKPVRLIYILPIDFKLQH